MLGSDSPAPGMGVRCSKGTEISEDRSITGHVRSIHSQALIDQPAIAIRELYFRRLCTILDTLETNSDAGHDGPRSVVPPSWNHMKDHDAPIATKEVLPSIAVPFRPQVESLSADAVALQEIGKRQRVEQELTRTANLLFAV